MSSPTNAAVNEPLVRFARKVSHDLNNFSTVVRTYSELLLSDLPQDSPTYADVAEIQRAAESMVQYVQRVTRFSRAGNIKRTTVSVDTAVQDALDQFSARVPSRAVVREGTTGASVHSDALWLRDMVLELLENAHEAAPPGTVVRVRTHAADGHVAISVEDEGPGFADAVRETACEPLMTTKNGLRGAGMGLSLASAFAGAMAGSLAIERTASHTSVTLQLPVIA